MADESAADELGYFATENKMFVSDLQETILHLLGLDPYKFHVPYQGLKQRLIGPVHDPKVRYDLIAWGRISHTFLLWRSCPTVSASCDICAIATYENFVTHRKS